MNDFATSVRARLLDIAKAQGAEFHQSLAGRIMRACASHRP